MGRNSTMQLKVKNKTKAIHTYKKENSIILTIKWNSQYMHEQNDKIRRKMYDLKRGQIK